MEGMDSKFREIIAESMRIRSDGFTGVTFGIKVETGRFVGAA